MKVKIKLSGNPDWHSEKDVIWHGDIAGADSLRPGSVITMQIGEIKTVFKVGMSGAQLSAKKVDDLKDPKKVKESILVIYVVPYPGVVQQVGGHNFDVLLG